MRISSLISQEKLATLEGRKKFVQRKEAGDAYRKNAQYFHPKKNPVLEELENLLFGNKDHDLYEKDKETKEETDEVKAAIRELQQNEQNVRAHEQAYKALGGDAADSTIFTQSFGGEEDTFNIVPSTTEEQTIQILENVKSAALAPTEPSTQDLRVAASANVQIQQVKATLEGNEAELREIDETPAFVHEPIEVSVPERFIKELKLDPIADTIFGKSFENAYRARVYHYAKSVYITQNEMVRNGYRHSNESTYSLSA